MPRCVRCSGEYVPDGLGRPSQRNGFVEDTVAQEVIEPTLGYDLHSPTQKLFEIRHEAAGEPWAWIRSDIHEQVEIAVRTCVAPSHRSKHANAGDTVLLRNSKDLIAL